nr:MAG TPA: hypothetical protein [Caudoviricetes sp.]
MSYFNYYQVIHIELWITFLIVDNSKTIHNLSTFYTLQMLINFI